MPKEIKRQEPPQLPKDAEIFLETTMALERVIREISDNQTPDQARADKSKEIAKESTN